MNHIAIDLGSRQSQICARDASNRIVWEQRVATKSLPALVTEWPRARIVLETCAEAMRVGDCAKAAGHDLRLVPATLVKVLGVGARGVKTDIKDARALSQASCLTQLPSVHLRSQRSRRRLQQLSARSAMVTARTQLINCVRGWLRGQLLTVRSTASYFHKNAREIFSANDMEMPAFVEQLFDSIEALSKQIRRAEKIIKQQATEDDDCRRLMSIPGVGPVTALCFVAIVDDVQRFRSAHALESYLGLTPGERSSSDTVRRIGITKAGPSMLRHYMTQASLSLRRFRSAEPISVWAQRIADRRGKQIAIIATARKLAGMMYAMLRDRTSYAPLRAATAAPRRAVAADAVRRALAAAPKRR